MKSYSLSLKCFWVAIEPLDEHTIAIHLADGHCSDMTGAIKIATAISSEITKIITLSGTSTDTMYVYEDSQWKAFSWTKQGEQRYES